MHTADIGGDPRSLRTAGFTLIELVIVVSIIGILASIAIPNFTRMSQKSRRAEAYEVLHGISMAQESYFTEYGIYAGDFDALGFEVGGGVRVNPTTIQGQNYTFTVATKPLNGAPAGNFRATATGDIDPTDAFLDVVIIENQLTVLIP